MSYEKLVGPAEADYYFNDTNAFNDETAGDFITTNTAQELNSVSSLEFQGEPAILDNWTEEEMNFNINVKYFSDDIEPLFQKKSDMGYEWVDLRAAEDTYIEFGHQKLIPLGFALELPIGWEAHIAARSSTFKEYGIIIVNAPGVIDTKYRGNNDQWMVNAYACNIYARSIWYATKKVPKTVPCDLGTQNAVLVSYNDDNGEHMYIDAKDASTAYGTTVSAGETQTIMLDDTGNISKVLDAEPMQDYNEIKYAKGIFIPKGERFAQFRIVPTQPKLTFTTVKELTGKDRGGFGSTGRM